MPETEAVKRAAEIIGISIRTAPKSAGGDDIVYEIFTSREKAQVAAEMLKIGKEIGIGKSVEIKKATETAWASDARTVRMSDCLILVGVRGRKPLGFNCGMCGWESCRSFLAATSVKGRPFNGPFCVFKLWDLGIAVDSAANQAKNFNIDNRIMYTAGVAGSKLNLLGGDVLPVLGLPLNAGGKNIYFDRGEKIEAMEILQRSAISCQQSAKAKK